VIFDRLILELHHHSLPYG